ncbi:hypothetical protein ACFX2I_004000 [Malus domestica]|uniref:putative F-box protein At1g23770 n=1 Tax=Malus domestica TaxID=3750 RepID=UPI003976888E
MEEIGGGSVAKKIMFLRRALTEELADERSNHERLVIAVHAVLLESGFVPIDPISGKQTDDQDRPHLLDKWSTLDQSQTMWVYYTLPQILQNWTNIEKSKGWTITGNYNVIEGGGGIQLMIQSRGNFVNVYPSLSGYRLGLYSPIHHLCLDEQRFCPAIEFLWANRDVDLGDRDLHQYQSPEKEILELWKICRDEIVLPFLIELCPMAGLPAPTVFMDLLPEIKRKIFESLSGVDILKVPGVCKKLRNLVNDDQEFWKHKFRSRVEG